MLDRRRIFVEMSEQMCSIANLEEREKRESLINILWTGTSTRVLITRPHDCFNGQTEIAHSYKQGVSLSSQLGN